MRKRAYRATSVKNLDPVWLIKGREGESCCVGMDVGKDDILAVLRWSDGRFERPWRAANPRDVRLLAARLGELSQGRRLVAALEPSGTYGDPLRQALGDFGVESHRVSPKQSHDYAEVFDGVPSQHDGKDAAVVAELAAIGKSSPWPYRAPSDEEQELALVVDGLEIHQRNATVWYGRLEAMLSRHWPEASKTLGISSATMLKALAHYGGPGPLAADPQAERRLRGWGGSFLSQDKVRELLHFAAATNGVRPTDWDLKRMRHYAAAALAARREIRQATRRLEQFRELNAVLAAQSPVVGAATACVLWAHLGDPRDYSCSEAYRKAMGLNLTERSSGRWKGQVKISKRGHRRVRRSLYFAALRWCRHPEVRSWYARKKARDGGHALGAVVGIMRKLALALYDVSVESEAFDPQRLFPGAQPPRRRAKVRAGNSLSSNSNNDSNTNSKKGITGASSLLPSTGDAPSREPRRRTLNERNSPSRRI